MSGDGKQRERVVVQKLREELAGYVGERDILNDVIRQTRTELNREITRDEQRRAAAERAAK